MKKALYFFIGVLSCMMTVMCLGGISASAGENTVRYQKVRYVLTAPGEGETEGTARIKGLAKDYNPTEIIIPEYVYDIGHPYRVTTIGDSAFSGSTLTKLVLPSTVTTIGKLACYNCQDLAELTIANGCESIGMAAFSGTALKELGLPDSVKELGAYAFYRCKDLQKIGLGAGLENIGFDSFGACTGLSSISISTENPNYMIKQGILYSADGTVLQSALAPKKKVVVPDTVTTIGDYAFEDCKEITKLTLGKNVTDIGKGAFYECEGLKTIKVNDRLKTLGDTAFYGCKSLKKISLGRSLETIGIAAFQHCEALSQVKLPGTLKEMSDNSFACCEKLTAISIGAGSSYEAKGGMILGENGRTLVSCPAMGDSVTIPSTVKTIEAWAFQGNINLTSVIMPSGVKKVLQGAFYGCKGLKKLRLNSLSVSFKAPSTMKSGSETISCAIFEGTPEGILIECPSGKEKAVSRLKKQLTAHCPGKCFIVSY